MSRYARLKGLLGKARETLAKTYRFRRSRGCMITPAIPSQEEWAAAAVEQQAALQRDPGAKIDPRAYLAAARRICPDPRPAILHGPDGCGPVHFRCADCGSIVTDSLADGQKRFCPVCDGFTEGAMEYVPKPAKNSAHD